MTRELTLAHTRYGRDSEKRECLVDIERSLTREGLEKVLTDAPLFFRLAGKFNIPESLVPFFQETAAAVCRAKLETWLEKIPKH